MKFAILVTGDPTSYTRNRYGDYARLFLDFLAQAGETWDVFDVRIGVFPDRPETYHGMVMTGSSSDAHGDADWIENLAAYIRRAESGGVRLLGVCFGHQILARALGGTAARNPAGWELGIHDVTLTAGFQQRFPQARSQRQVPILEVHRDHVARLPPGGVLLATSPATPVQAFALGDRVLGIQGHPEFNRDIVRDLIDTRLSAGLVDAGRAEKARRSLNARLEADWWRRIALRFLKADSPIPTPFLELEKS